MHFFFDLDDTLVQTQATYDEVNRKTTNLVLTLINHAELFEEVLRTSERFDIENSKRYGFNKDRFPQTWIQTLVYYALKHDIAITDVQKEQVAQSANEVFQIELPKYEDTLSALSRIAALGHPMHILTAGEESVQRKRLEDANLLHYFEEVHVVPTKNPDIMKGVLAGRDPQKSVMFGNSLRSDIYPALENGMFAVHLKRQTWAYDNYEIDTTCERYFSVHNLTEGAVILENGTIG
jgi:putative hydrolase of the HAD superfamily